MATLERWEVQQPAVLRQLADRLVPLLEPYLQEASDQELQPAPLTALGAPWKFPCPWRAVLFGVRVGAISWLSAVDRAMAHQFLGMQRPLRSYGVRNEQPLLLRHIRVHRNTLVGADAMACCGRHTFLAAAIVAASVRSRTPTRA